jgi:hypothetical protein
VVRRVIVGLVYRDGDPAIGVVCHVGGWLWLMFHDFADGVYDGQCDAIQLTTIEPDVDKWPCARRSAGGDGG